MLDLSSDGTSGSRQVHADSEDPGDAHWLDGDNSRVEDDMDFITCARDTFIADEDVNLTT